MARPQDGGKQALPGMRPGPFGKNEPLMTRTDWVVRRHQLSATVAGSHVLAGIGWRTSGRRTTSPVGGRC